MQLLSMRAGPALGRPRVLTPSGWKLWVRGSQGSRGLRGVASSGRRADSGGRGGPRGGATVNGGRGGEFHRARWIPRLELPKQLFVGSAQSLLLLGFFLHVFLEISIFL